LNRKGLAVGIVLLFLISTVPFINGESDLLRGEDSFKDVLKEDYQQYRDDWSVHITNQSNDDERSSPVYKNEGSSNEVYIKLHSSSTAGPMDSPWPMQGRDVYHSCRSPYSTENNLGAEIWRIHGDKAGGVESSAVIDGNGIIYFGTLGSDSSLYALYPNGTRKWRYHANGLIWSTPAIAEDGTIYLPSWGSHLIALYPNGQVKWDISAQDPIASSVTIGEDGTIYIGTMGGNLYAVNPNGTEQWHLYLGGNLISSPAIGTDNIIYIGTTSNYLYAVNPNGTLRWQFRAGQFKGNPSIAADGTIYAPSFDGYLYALYPNGTMKWCASTGGSVAGAGVALGENGIIYIGTECLRAFYPNGTLKWSVDVKGDIYGTVPAVSADGTIYVSAGLSLVAVNPDGTEKWRKEIANQYAKSSPSIGEDGTVYVGSTSDDYGYLHAFGIGELSVDADGPYTGSPTNPVQFIGTIFGGIPPYDCHWDFGDGNTSGEEDPIYTYAHAGEYTATFTVTDSEGNFSSDTANITITDDAPTVQITKPECALYIMNVKIRSYLNSDRIPLIIGPIDIDVDTSQEQIGIDKVEFYIDDVLKATDNTRPYSWTWNTPAFFTHTIKVTAYDTSGNSASDDITVKKYF
jgi:outer membrane protein assembly factor BamB